MGLTKAEDSPGLCFELDNSSKRSYSPGDTISGRVVLNTADDIAIGKVIVTFWGRAKSRIIQQHGQTVTYHRGRTQFFTQELVLYEGQYTHKPGTFSWPFEFTVPDKADASSILGGEKWKPKDNFRGTAVDEDKLDLTLPASCYHRRHMFGRQAESFVEYVLDVTLTEPDGLHHIRGPQSKVSTYPITFHPLSTPEPIQNYNFTTEQRLFTISTLKLLPEHAGTSLGFRDRARSLFQRDSIPRFSFSLVVQAPTLIQLMHPDPIPFLITATPDLSPALTTVDTSTSLPTVTLRSAKIELKTYIRCRAAGTFDDSKTYEINLLTNKALSQPLTMVRGMTTASDATLDLGKLCNMRLASARLGSRLEAPLCPNFTSYNVSRSYQLLWELEVECAEKTEKFSGVKNGPECNIILPPATVGVDSVVPESNTLSAPDLAPAMSRVSAESTGSGSTFWTSRSKEKKDAGKKEKAAFKVSSTPLSGASPGLAVTTQSDANETSKAKSKAQEAAEERALARMQGIQSAYQRRNEDASRPGRLDDDEADPAEPDVTADRPLTMITITDNDNQLPRYVP